MNEQPLQSPAEQSPEHGEGLRQRLLERADEMQGRLAGGVKAAVAISALVGALDAGKVSAGEMDNELAKAEAALASISASLNGLEESASNLGQLSPETVVEIQKIQFDSGEGQVVESAENGPLSGEEMVDTAYELKESVTTETVADNEAMADAEAFISAVEKQLYSVDSLNQATHNLNDFFADNAETIQELLAQKNMPSNLELVKKEPQKYAELLQKVDSENYDSYIGTRLAQTVEAVENNIARMESYVTAQEQALAAIAGNDAIGADLKQKFQSLSEPVPEAAQAIDVAKQHVAHHRQLGLMTR